MSRHRFPCSDPDCEWCERQAEARAEAAEPDFDLDAAADRYERSVGL